MSLATPTQAQPQPQRILIADDQPDVLIALKLLLKAEGYQTEAVDSPDAIVRTAKEKRFDLILMDLNYTRDTTSGEEGLDVLARLQGHDSAPPVIVMTAWGSVELAVEAMRRGARDFVMKPWDNMKLMGTLRTHLAAAAKPQAAPAATSTSAPRASEEKVVRDLEIARQVQTKLFPQRVIPMRTLDYAGHCRQAGQVGGDYYDFLDIGPGRLGLVLADISGKGIAAALLMSNLQAALRSLAWQASSNLALLLRTVNMQFRESTSPNHFATLFFGDYDDARRTLRYVNCGHNPPLVLRTSGRMERLEATSIVLGIIPNFQPEVREIPFNPGDVLAIYSDGVTEAPTPSGDDLGEDGLLKLLAKYKADTPEVMAKAITGTIAEISGGDQADDITLLIARGR